METDSSMSNGSSIKDHVKDSLSSDTSSFISDQSYYDEIVDEYVLNHDEQDGSQAVELRDKKIKNID